MPNYVKRLEARGLHGRLDIDLDLSEGINILYGRNGTGKTTVMHVLANIFDGSIDRFVYLKFDRIMLIMSDDHVVDLVRENAGDEKGDIVSLFFDQRKVLDILVDDEVRLQQNAQQSETDREFQRMLRERASNIRKGLGIGQAAYFPAFRSIVEALWSGGTNSFLSTATRSRARLPGSGPSNSSSLTRLARTLFGEFVPLLDYPSPFDIETELILQLNMASRRIDRESQITLSNAFIEVIEGLSSRRPDIEQTPTEILEDIKMLLETLDRKEITEDASTRGNDVYAQLRDVISSLKSNEFSDAAANVLSVYHRFLNRRVYIEEQEFSPIANYLNSVNEFLEGKRMVIQPPTALRKEPTVGIEFDEGSTISLRSLSSGERQVVSMLYAASHISESNDIVLIDEPELSLHIDWQRILLSRMAKQLGARQIIVSTHSPEVGADYEDCFQEVRPTVNDKYSFQIDEEDFSDVPF